MTLLGIPSAGLRQNPGHCCLEPLWWCLGRAQSPNPANRNLHAAKKSFSESWEGSSCRAYKRLERGRAPNVNNRGWGTPIGILPIGQSCFSSMLTLPTHLPFTQENLDGATPAKVRVESGLGLQSSSISGRIPTRNNECS